MTYDPTELKEILRLHALWLDGEKGGERADLTGADLYGVDLHCVDLTGVNLSRANLTGADLTNANLSCANLTGADLTGAYLTDTIGDGVYIRTLQTDRWIVTYTSEVIQIGCQVHAIEDWWNFTDDRIAEMDNNALEWWKRWKPILQKIVTELSPAEPTKQEGTK